MALLIALGVEVAGAALAFAVFPVPPALPPVYGGQDAVHAQNITGRTFGRPPARHARQGRHGHPTVAPTPGVHAPAARHRATVTA